MPIAAKATKQSPNAFILFTLDERPKIKAVHPGIRFTELCTKLGENWRKLSIKKKNEYTRKAATEKSRAASKLDALVAAAEGVEGRVEEEEESEEEEEEKEEEKEGDEGK